MEFSGNSIKIDRELSDLDSFALDFIRILEKHTDYVIVSGYVSILLGRARASEDIDIFIPNMEKIDFLSLFNDIYENGFYCLNDEKGNTIYYQITNGFSVRFAKKNTVVPNIEIKIVRNEIEEQALENKINVILKEGSLNISNLELQIAFKEEVLKSPKDLEDARHIMYIAEGYLDKNLIQKYKEKLRVFY